MCMISVVMQHKSDEWKKRFPLQNPLAWPTLPTQQEIDEFRTLLDRAREYDKKMGEPDCEMAEKRQKLLDLAKDLGVDISFVSEGSPDGR